MQVSTQTSYWVLGHRITPLETSGQYDLIEIETPPQVPGPPPHCHYTYAELFYVLEGEVEFLVDGEIRNVQAGEHVNIQPGTVHTFNNKSDASVRILNVHSPKGFWSFFEKFGIESTLPDAFAASVDAAVIQQVLAEAESFDMHIKV